MSPINHTTSSNTNLILNRVGQRIGHAFDLLSKNSFDRAVSVCEIAISSIESSLESDLLQRSDVGEGFLFSNKLDELVHLLKIIKALAHLKMLDLHSSESTIANVRREFADVCFPENDVISIRYKFARMLSTSRFSVFQFWGLRRELYLLLSKFNLARAKKVAGLENKNNFEKQLLRLAGLLAIANLGAGTVFLVYQGLSLLVSIIASVMLTLLFAVSVFLVYDSAAFLATDILGANYNKKLVFGIYILASLAIFVIFRIPYSSWGIGGIVSIVGGELLSAFMWWTTAIQQKRKNQSIKTQETQSQ